MEGRAIYYIDSEGSLHEDETYRKAALKLGTTFCENQVPFLCEASLDYINRFFFKLHQNPRLLSELPQKYGFLADIAKERGGEEFTPAELDFPMNDLIAEIGNAPFVQKMGFATQIMVAGVDKGLPIRWLHQNSAYRFDATKCVAIGDSPLSDDTR